MRRVNLRLALVVSLVTLVLSACGLANPWPSDHPRAEHHTVLMIGDSLLGQTDVTLHDVMQQRGFDVTIIDAHLNGTGLIGPVGDQPDALHWVTEQVQAHPEADTVVMEYAGACALCGTTGYPGYGDAASGFYDRWRANGIAIINYLRSQGKIVLWVRSPLPGASGELIASGSQYRINVSIVLTWLAQADFKPLVDGWPDWWVALTDVTDGYQTFLSYDGATHKVRFDDYVHLEMDGSIRTSTWTASALGDTWTAHPITPQATSGQAPTSGLIQAGDPVTLEP